MESKLKLNKGEKLKHLTSSSKDTHAETNIYSIVDLNGKFVGYVEHIVYALNEGVKQTQKVVQKDNDGRILVEVSW